MHLSRWFASLALMLVTTPVLASTDGAISDRAVSEAFRYFRRGNFLLAHGRIDAAERSFVKAIGRFPHYPEAQMGLGHIALQRGRFEQALEHYLAAKAGYESLGERRFDLAMERYKESREKIRELNDAISELTHGMTNPEMASMVNLGGAGQGQNSQFLLDQLRREIRSLESIQIPTLTDSPKVPGEVFFFIGNARFRLGRHSEALMAWETCAQVTPDFPLVHNNLATVYMILGRHQEALNSLRRAEQLGVAVNPMLKRDIEAAAGQASVPH